MSLSPSGVLVVDKPCGPTSHDVVARVRRLLGEPRIGHTGTLDPMASGVLVLVLGRATRLVRFLDADDKAYDATVRLGFSTDTQDALGRPIGTRDGSAPPDRDAIDRALDPFRGTFLQQPPAFSAKKIGGRRSYRLARAHARATATSAPPAIPASPALPAVSTHPALPAVDVPPAPPAVPALPSVFAPPAAPALPPVSARPAPPAAPAAPAPPALPAPVTVTTRSVDVVSVEHDLVKLRIVCSGGFYVRSLAHDLGEALGTGAHLVALVRTRASGFDLRDAVSLDAIERDADGRARAIAAVVPLPNMLPGMQAIVLTDLGAARAARGCLLGPGDVGGGIVEGESISGRTEHVRLLDERGALVGIARRKAPNLLHPVVVLV